MRSISTQPLIELRKQKYTYLTKTLFLPLINNNINRVTKVIDNNT